MPERTKNVSHCSQFLQVLKDSVKKKMYHVNKNTVMNVAVLHHYFICCMIDSSYKVLYKSLQSLPAGIGGEVYVLYHSDQWSGWHTF